MWRRIGYNPTAYDDDWEDQPGQGMFYQWGLGAALPLAILAFGLHAIMAGETYLPGEQSVLPLHGFDARLFGMAAISVSLFLHCHYFWGNIYNQAWFAVLGKIAAALGFIAGMGTLIVRVGIWGR